MSSIFEGNTMSFDTHQSILHALDISIPAIAGYTTRARMIVENQEAGWDPAVITSLRQPRARAEVTANEVAFPQEEYGGVRYFRSDDWQFARAVRGWELPVLREVSEMLPFKTTLRRIAQSLPSAIIHAHSPILVGYPAQRAARRLGIPFVYEIRAPSGRTLPLIKKNRLRGHCVIVSLVFSKPDWYKKLTP